MTEDGVTIDGASGQEIPGKFAEVYSELFNRESDDDEVMKISESIENKIDEESWKEFRKLILQA